MEEREDILAPYAGRISYGALLKLREKRGREHIWIDPWDELRGLLSFLPRIQAKSVCLDSDIVSIGDRSEVSQDVIDIIEKCICALIPWRKGPYSLFGRVIDSEWRSDLKWNRIEPFLDDPHEKKVADIGGNNGYFLFRMANYSPKLMVNFDPNGRFYYQFELLHRFSGVDNMQHEVLGVEDVHLFENFFDIVLFMGVIYHCRDPLGALRQVYTCLKPGGQMIFESLALPGRKPVSLTPPGRYGKMRNA
ncbi:MAG: tRNA 5-methoxyuridine(34)/uridine 5-oxyacetic acid(34) synthase CmoB, partial [Candidatus Dadabacteria bacterium]